MPLPYNVLAKKIYLILAGLVSFLVFKFMIMMLPDQVGEQIVALQLSFNINRAQAILDGWGSQTITHYLQWYWIDYVYALSYNYFFLSLLDWIWPIKRSDRSRWSGFVFILPWIALCSDWLENSLHFFLLLSYPIIQSWLVGLASCFALVKWTAISSMIIIFIISLIYKLILIRRINGYER